METTFGTSAFSPVTTVTRGEKTNIIVKISKFSGKDYFFLNSKISSSHLWEKKWFYYLLLSLLKVEMWSKYIKIRINIVLRAIFMKGAILDRALRHALWYILFFVIIILIKYYTWVEKVKTKCNVGIHGNIKSWLWVEYIASTGVRIIIIVIVLCWGTYVRIIIIVLCWGTMKNKTYFFNSLSPLYKLRLRILINFALRFSWNCYSTFFF